MTKKNLSPSPQKKDVLQSVLHVETLMNNVHVTDSSNGGGSERGTRMHRAH